jgi:hypothetical protein
MHSSQEKVEDSFNKYESEAKMNLLSMKEKA